MSFACPRPRAPILLVLLVAALCAASACKKDRPVELIRRTLDEAIGALGNKDAREAGAVLADDFVDDAKRGKKDLVRLAFLAVQRGPVFVKLTSVDTTVQGDEARSQVSALAVQGSAAVHSAADLLDTNARTFQLTLSWRREGGAWRITRIEGLPSVSLD